jgi:hypothetical protein
MTSKSDLIPQTSTSTAIAINDGVDPLLAYADAISPQNIVGELLKFAKGDYIAGENNIIEPGTQFTANVDEFLAGWIKWQEGKPVEQRMVRVNDGAQPPLKRHELGDLDQSQWEVDKGTGEPKDPWQFSNYLPMMDVDGNLFTFTTSSRGGLDTVAQLVRRYGKHRKHNPDVHPVIALNVGSYKHANKAYGIIKYPDFAPAGYEHKARFTNAMLAAGYAVDEVAPADADPADEMNDEIPL